MGTHFAGLAQYAIARAALHKTDRVIDIGSNDGFLLKNFLKAGTQVLGIDPAENLVKKAIADGVDTVNAFFSKAVAEQVAVEKGRAKVVLGTNVFAHVPDVHDFLEGAKALLTDDGFLIIEVPYLLPLLDHAEFDTIYQEHLSYFSLTPIATLLAQHEMGLVDATLVPVHGGSLRITASRGPAPIGAQAESIIAAETARGILNPDIYMEFTHKVNQIRHDLVQLLWDLKCKGNRIVGYGASAKGNILLNYCRIGRETLDYIADSIPLKQGKFAPGTHIPIYPEAKLVEDQPDYALMMAWNFAEEMIQKQAAYQRAGGKFILAIPKVRVL
jgi:SAM-dependent methyltransferase